MNQFFFGDVDRPLYGVHHAPQSGEVRQVAILICYPIGREYMRCHRALVRLCERFAQLGYHSMRFDYYGTGDSAGESGDGSVEEWLANTQSAAQELRDVSGAPKIAIIGVRIGATLAAYAATDEKNVEALVLWDPVSDGTRYIEEMRQMHNAFIIDVDRFPEVRARDLNVSEDELVGMPFPSALRQSIRQIDLTSIDALTANSVDFVVTSDMPQYRKSHEHLRSLAGSGDYHVVDESASWDALSDLGVVIMPNQLLQSIVAIIAGDQG